MRIGIISAKLNSVDGVSLEAHKWQKIFQRMGHQVYLCAGSIQKTPTPHYIIPELDYQHQEVLELAERVYADPDFEVSKYELIAQLADKIRGEVAYFIVANALDMLDIENLLSLPLNLPAGLALVKLVMDSPIPVICRHHDFYWERDKLSMPAVAGYLKHHFPPQDLETAHVVINSLAQKALRERHGVEAALIPNAFDFDSLTALDDYNCDFRQSLGLDDRHVIFLQPSRIVPRKCIERSIELVARVQERLADHRRRAVLLISGPPADEPDKDYYLQKLRAQAKDLAVRIITAHDRIFITRKTINGTKIYSIGDAYAHADFVTFPSDKEGFGNPVIEAAAYGLPLFVNQYPVLSDILSKGFKFVAMKNDLTEATVEQVHALLTDASLRAEWGEHNRQLVKRYYSLDAVGEKLKEIMEGVLKVSIWNKH